LLGSATVFNCFSRSTASLSSSRQPEGDSSTVRQFNVSTIQAEVVLIVSVVPNVPVVHGSESWAEKNSATRGGGLRFANCLLVYHQVDMISGAM